MHHSAPEIRALGYDGIGMIADIVGAPFDPHFNEAWSIDQIKAALLLPQSNLLALVVDQEPAGFALFTTLLSECEILLLGILPQLRGLGYGKLLYEAILTRCAEVAVGSLFLEVRENNPAIQFYQHLGMKPIGRRQGYYRDVESNLFDAITMRTDINVDSSRKQHILLTKSANK